MFTDLEKCFDKLWLEDAIVGLVKNGMNIEEAGYLYKMNKEVNAVIATPAGETEEIQLKRVVKQGTVGGPVMTGVTTDNINTMKTGEPIMYGKVEIKHPTFVDDITGMGTRGNMVDMNIKMEVLETTKKFTFSNKDGKTNIMIMKNNNKEEKELELYVKRGKIKKTDKYKYLGDIYTDKGNNIEKIQGRIKNIEYMATEVKRQGSYYRVGKADTQVRRLLIEATVIPSILANTETWTNITKKEMEMLDKAQYRMMLIIYEQKQGTPYLGMLNETGFWPFSFIVKYKQLMWLHTLIHSEERRVARKVLLEQFEEKEKNWVQQVKQWSKEIGIIVKLEIIKQISKPKWKKMVKDKLEKRIQLEIQEEANKKTKLRFIKEEKFEEKQYMKRYNMKTCKEIMKLRLNMIDVKANFKGDHKENMNCSAGCNVKESTEHILKCKKIKEVVGHNIKGEIAEMMKDHTWLRNTAKEIKKIEETKRLLWN